MDGWFLLGLFLLVLLAIYACRKVLTLILTWRALAWLPSLSRRLSNWVKARDYTEEEFFRADGAAGPGLSDAKRLSTSLPPFSRRSTSQSIAWAKAIRDSFSDLRFTDANRVPFPFARVMREKFNLCSVVTASHGPRLQNLDGQWTHRRERLVRCQRRRLRPL